MRRCSVCTPDAVNTPAAIGVAPALIRTPPGESGGCSTRLSCGRGSSRRPGYPTVGAAGQIRESRGERPRAVGRALRSKSGGDRRCPLRGVAIRAAEASRPDVVFGPYGSGPALAAAAAAKGVVWNHGGATARLARPAYPGVVNVESPAYRYLAAVLESLAAEGLGAGSQVVIIHVDTGFGREVAEGAAVAARRLGLLWRSVTFRPGRAKRAGAGPGGRCAVIGRFLRR